MKWAPYIIDIYIERGLDREMNSVKNWITRGFERNWSKTADLASRARSLCPSLGSSRQLSGTLLSGAIPSSLPSVPYLKGLEAISRPKFIEMIARTGLEINENEVTKLSQVFNLGAHTTEYIDNPSQNLSGAMKRSLASEMIGLMSRVYTEGFPQDLGIDTEARSKEIRSFLSRKYVDNSIFGATSMIIARHEKTGEMTGFSSGRYMRMGSPDPDSYVGIYLWNTTMTPETITMDGRAVKTPQREALMITMNFFLTVKGMLLNSQGLDHIPMMYVGTKTRNPIVFGAARSLVVEPEPQEAQWFRNTLQLSLGVTIRDDWVVKDLLPMYCDTPETLKFLSNASVLERYPHFNVFKQIGPKDVVFIGGFMNPKSAEMYFSKMTGFLGR